MSSQKGNSNRSRPQKYQNSHAFKNNLYDTSHTTKTINKIQVINVCKRCKDIIEWKIKYKKYKPLKTPSKCNKCEQKGVKHAYHTVCGPCAFKLEICPKCGEKTEIIKPEVKEEPLKLDRELRLLLKKLPERKRRTFYRYMKRGEIINQTENSDKDTKQLNEEEEKKLITDKDKVAEQVVSLTRDDLLAKLQSLIIANDRKDDDDDIEDHELDDFCKKMNNELNQDINNYESGANVDNDSNNVNEKSNKDVSYDGNIIEILDAVVQVAECYHNVNQCADLVCNYDNFNCDCSCANLAESSNCVNYQEEYTFVVSQKQYFWNSMVYKL